MPLFVRPPIVTILLIATILFAPYLSPDCRLQRANAQPNQDPLARRRAQRNALDPAKVLTSIDRAISYLKRKQNPRGNWGDPTAFPGGITALSTLALLNAGLDSSDPTIMKGVEYLRRLDTKKKTYIISLQTMVFSQAEPQKDRVRIQELVQWLEKIQFKEGKNAGGWGYDEDTDLSADPSNSQFAVLALYEAQLAGAKVQEETWRLASRYWRQLQDKSGGWRYRSEESISGSMTCAGISSLIITNLASKTSDAKVVGSKVNCCLPHDEDKAIERGLAWLARNFSIRRNPGNSLWHYYYLYALERAGRLSANRFIGQHDWYREGTAHLVNSQGDPSNSWAGKGTESYEEISTSFALLFLSKGRRPVVMAKLRFGEEEDTSWNHHRHDVTHLVREAELAWDLPMTWQVVDAQQASREDLQQSPVLYISGTQINALMPQAKKLREYLDRGGFLFAESCCGADAQARAKFNRLIDAIFPEPEYGLRQMRPEHPVWRMESLVRPSSSYVGSLWAVEYGCRTSVVFCDRDLSCYWELDAIAQRDGYPPTVRQQVEDARTIGVNVLAYATNREPKGKEQQFIERMSDLEIGGDQLRGVIQVAKLQHTGGCNDAPGALDNLLRIASEGETKLRIAPTAPLIGLENQALAEHHFAFMHGRNDFRLSATERRELKAYLQNGGTLLADAICSSSAFTKAFRRELSATFDGRTMEGVGANEPLLRDSFGGYDIRRVELRDPMLADMDQPVAVRVRKTTPRLEGLKIDGRWAVIFSPYDLSCALERQEVVECRGYRREDAARIGLNVLLYSINQ